MSTLHERYDAWRLSMGLVRAVPEVPAFQFLRECGCHGNILCTLHDRDKLYLRDQHVCWSLSTAGDYWGELPVMSQQTKELVQKEAILWHGKEKDPRWKAFE
jgi:hypothetical protein